jgi:hypothetical protein
MSFTDDDLSYPTETRLEDDSPAASASASDLRSSVSDLRSSVSDLPTSVSDLQTSVSDIPELDTLPAQSGCLTCCNSCYVPRNWLNADYLLWWTKGNPVPALVTSSPAGTPQVGAGVLPAATTEFGGEQIANEYRHGLRLTFGHWSDCEGTVGWQATYFSVFDDDQHGDFAGGTTGVFGAGTGSPILGRPFFNENLQIEDSRLISFPGIVDGAINIDSSSEIHSFSWMLRQHWRSGSRGRIDLIGGYRYFRFREGLLIRENLITTDPLGGIPLGSTLDIEDRFLVENDFHGGDMGFIAEFWRCGWSLEILAKVAVGNLRRSADIYGSTVTTIPGGAPVTTDGGLLALPTNSGHRAANDFAALPEIGLNLKYEPSPSMSVNIGYTLLMLNDIVRTGELIDRTVNTTQLSGAALAGSPRPASQSQNETDFWAQGLNFGVTFSR